MAREDDRIEKLIDETNAESFPASDPPAWTLGGELRPDLDEPSTHGTHAQRREPEVSTVRVTVVEFVVRMATIEGASDVPRHDAADRHSHPGPHARCGIGCSQPSASLWECDDEGAYLGPLESGHRLCSEEIAGVERVTSTIAIRSTASSS
ncbi:hypothetical protein [Labilithrix luteola]|nr:hypothetical protein [Labilithrix luteola]